MIRVTEPLNFFKEQWYIDWVHRVGRTEANKISKASMAIGTKVDGYVKADPFGQMVMPKEKPEVQMAMVAYKKWLDVYKPKAITPGTRLFATIEGQEVSGEPDIFVDGVLVDIKCSSKISPSYWVQVNMYRHIEPGPYGKDGKSKVGILRLDKLTGSYEYVVKDYDASLVDVWVGLMRAMVYFKGESHDGDEL